MTRFTPYSARYPKGGVLQADDPPAMVEAIRVLAHARIPFRRVSAHQLKLSPTLSFYPARGTIMYDSRPPLPQRGLPALLDLLRGTSEASVDQIRSPAQPAQSVLPITAGAPSIVDGKLPWNE